MSLQLIKIYIQIRAVEAVAAVGTGYLAILLVHLMTASVADVDVIFPRLFFIPLNWLEE